MIIMPMEFFLVAVIISLVLFVVAAFKRFLRKRIPTNVLKIRFEQYKDRELSGR